MLQRNMWVPLIGMQTALQGPQDPIIGKKKKKKENITPKITMIVIITELQSQYPKSHLFGSDTDAEDLYIARKKIPM